jgi:hypothetical protein
MLSGMRLNNVSILNVLNAEDEAIRMIKREHVYLIIESERKYQDENWPGTANVGEHLVLMQTYLNEAMQKWTHTKGDETALQEIRKVAALAIRCMEQHGVAVR